MARGKSSSTQALLARLLSSSSVACPASAKGDSSVIMRRALFTHANRAIIEMSESKSRETIDAALKKSKRPFRV